MIDSTHALSKRSWVSSANGHASFPIQNLPHCVFSVGGDAPRGGIAIGDEVLDLAKLATSSLASGAALEGLRLAAASSLNDFLGAGASVRQAVRGFVSDLLDEKAGSATQKAVASMLVSQADCIFHLPATIVDYTDFYAGIHHANTIGSLFRPDAPLLPNYKHIPIGYHGRASSVGVSGATVKRPQGQYRIPNQEAMAFGPCRNLDYELELGIWIGPGNELGSPIGIAEADAHVAGFCLLNDWSARDIQAWEYQPLGPFLAKNFATTLSPFVITPEALAPFRVGQAKRAEGDPKPLPYLWDENDQKQGAFNIKLSVFIQTKLMKEQGLPPHRLSGSNVSDLYWTVNQMVAHHTVGGCNLRPGDLFGSGTISGPCEGQYGSLMELTKAGRQALTLPNGETRTYLQSGDTITLTAACVVDGFAQIGFGDCSGTIA